MGRRRDYGSGSIREKRPGYFELRVMATDPVTGSQRQISRGFRGTRKGAQQQLAALVQECASGRRVSTEATVATLLRQWLEQAGPRLSPNTVRRYEGLARIWVIPHIGQLTLRKLLPSDLDRLYVRMERAGLAPASIVQCHRMLSRALGQARRWHWIAENPAADASPPRVRRTEIVPPGPDDVRRLLALARAHSPEAGMLLHLAAVSGARRGELVGLRWSDLDAEGGRLTFRRSVQDSGVLKETKTERVRVITLGAGALEALAVYHAYVVARADEMGVALGDDGFLFTADADGARPWNPSTATHLFEQLRAKAGLPKARLHDLRHFSATTQLSAGIPVKEVSGRHGWADATMPLNRYGHFLPGGDRASAELMDRVVGEP